jgi:hypothetical protein
MRQVMLIGEDGKLSSSVGSEEVSIRPRYVIIRNNDCNSIYNTDMNLNTITFCFI